jgi:Glycogen recognition site of AMP-activated protein kinase
MDALFASYFDGDLSDREAKEFLAAIAADPRLERELREYERILALGKALPSPEAPARFTERVMAQISLEEKRGTSAAPTRREWAVRDVKPEVPAAGGGPERKSFRIPLFGNRWAGMGVAAAAIVLAYIGGIYTADNRNISPGFTDRVAAESGPRYVRLAYLPADPSVQKVTVVGSFNNWDPEAMPLRRENGVWSTILVLAPGSYEYMFLENGARWVTDPLAVETRNDGFGGANAVLDVGS